VKGGISRRLFALDQNFPESVLAALAEALPMAELVPVRKVAPELAAVEDWQLLLALHREQRRWDGLITNDAAILALPKELTVLSQTALTLVVVKGEGDSPVRATGALLCHLPFICHHTRPEYAQVWKLGVAQKPFERVDVYLDKVAERQGTDATSLFERYKLTPAELNG
jgi:hypothetical protein